MERWLLVPPFLFSRGYPGFFLQGPYLMRLVRLLAGKRAC
jgi:hypothetical protein